MMIALCEKHGDLEQKAKRFLAVLHGTMDYADRASQLEVKNEQDATALREALSNVEVICTHLGLDSTM